MSSSFYLLALAGVGVALVALVLDAVLSVSRKPRWQVERAGLRIVTSIDRRRESLPFVGADRRQGQDPGGDTAAAELREAA